MLFRSLHTQTLLEPSPPRPPTGGIRTQCSSVRMKAFFFLSLSLGGKEDTARQASFVSRHDINVH